MNEVLSIYQGKVTLFILFLTQFLYERIIILLSMYDRPVTEQMKHIV